jgi:transposase
MQFYTKKHQYYCGIDLHTQIIYICLLNSDGKVLLHKQTKANPDALMKLITPYLDDLVICVECMFTWYWVSNFCHQHRIQFVLGHALYMKAIHGGKAKNDKIDSYKIAKLLHSGMLAQAYDYPEGMRATRDLLRRRTFFVRQCAELKTHTKIINHQYNLPPIKRNLKHTVNHSLVIEKFEDPSAKRSVQANTDLISFYHQQIRNLELFVKRTAKVDDYFSFMLLKSIKGVGDVLALTILYEIHTIARFPSVQKFASYARLIKCKSESAGKVYGTSGNKIGNAHLKWAFSEASALYLRGNEKAQNYHARLVNKHGKGKAMAILSHKLGRAVYFMLKQKEPFNESAFLNG